MNGSPLALDRGFMLRGVQQRTPNKRTRTMILVTHDHHPDLIVVYHHGELCKKFDSVDELLGFFDTLMYECIDDSKRFCKSGDLELGHDALSFALDCDLWIKLIILNGGTLPCHS